MRACIDINDHVFDELKVIANKEGMSAYQYMRELIELAVAYKKGMDAGEKANEQTKNIL